MLVRGRGTWKCRGEAEGAKGARGSSSQKEAQRSEEQILAIPSAAVWKESGGRSGRGLTKGGVQLVRACSA